MIRNKELHLQQIQLLSWSCHIKPFYCHICLLIMMVISVKGISHQACLMYFYFLMIQYFILCSITSFLLFILLFKILCYSPRHIDQKENWQVDPKTHFFFLAAWDVGCGILVPNQGLNQCPQQWKRSVNHCTAREVPKNTFLNLSNI